MHEMSFILELRYLLQFRDPLDHLPLDLGLQLRLLQMLNRVEVFLAVVDFSHNLLEKFVEFVRNVLL